jgi:hypothetical protein
VHGPQATLVCGPGRSRCTFVDGEEEDIDWSPAARLEGLVHAAPWGPALLKAERELLQSAVSRVEAHLDSLITADAVELGRGGIENDWF